VAAIAGVKPSVLRFWETEFRWLRPDKSPTNQRVYNRKQVERVLEVKALLRERGFTIAGAKKHLARGGGPTDGGGGDLLERIKKEVRELLQLVDE
jgi:DNA-binding transcriptional MerR regulator